jgi:hypothetical protein
MNPQKTAMSHLFLSLRNGSLGQFQLLNDGAEKEQYIPKHKEQNGECANHLLWCGSSDEQENEHYCQDR